MYRRLWILLTLLVSIPLVFAWTADVYTLPLSVEVVYHADNPGCVYVLFGQVEQAFIDHTAVEGNTFCLTAGERLYLKVDGGFIALFGPEARYRVHADPLAHVVMSGRLLVVDWPLLPLFLVVIIVLGVLFLLSKLVRGKRSSLPGLEGKVLAYVRTHPGCTQKEIARALGIEKYRVTRVMQKLESMGYVRRERRGKTKKVYPTS